MQHETKTENGITYVKRGDYWIPELEMPEQKEAGRFGRMRLKFIRENRKALYDGLICRCELNSYLSRIDEEAEEMVSRLEKELLEKNPAPDKAKDQMGWTAHMNMIREQATELTTAELIYN